MFELKIHAMEAKLKLTGQIIRVLRSSLLGYVFDVGTRRIYHTEELEFGRTMPRIFSYEDVCPNEDYCENGLPF